MSNTATNAHHLTFALSVLILSAPSKGAAHYVHLRATPVTQMEVARHVNGPTVRETLLKEMIATSVTIPIATPAAKTIQASAQLAPPAIPRIMEHVTGAVLKMSATHVIQTTLPSALNAITITI
jgi:hypothetical protein